jgi:HlyD family secretion protein
MTGSVAALNGNAVTIALAGTLPAGTLAGTSVFVRIEYTPIANTSFVERPVNARENTQATLFWIEPGANSATRMPVRYGRVAADLIAVREGLNAGEDVIVSEPGSWLNHTRIRLE